MAEQFSTFVADWSRKWQYLLDKSSPHPLYRWIVFGAVLILYLLRVYLLDGMYIVSRLHGFKATYTYLIILIHCSNHIMYSVLR